MERNDIRSEIIRFLREKVLPQQKTSFHRQEVADFFEHKVEDFCTERGSHDRKLILEELHRLTLEFILIPGLSSNFYEAEPFYTLSEQGITLLRND